MKIYTEEFDSDLPKQNFLLENLDSFNSICFRYW